MSQVPSRPSSPKPQSILNLEEPNSGVDMTPGVTHFVEPIIFFKVQGVIFGLPRSRVLKSGFFRGMMESPHLGDSKEGTAEHPIVFDDRTGIAKADMQSFCAVLDVRAFEPGPTLSVAEWASAYRLSKMWEFEQVHNYICKYLDELVKDPFERIELADCLGLKEWVAPALVQLCMRDAPLTASEGARLGIDRFANVCRTRETGRTLYDLNFYEGQMKSVA
ncbi:hypothetical protein FS837_012925 [Tulasnella sp. UAMH 9824]|nr:hypothetical protein FS837_012925 [Tulasnella sp. UAMH 9824]